MKVTMMGLFILCALSASAQDENIKPCLEVKKACESAGFTKGKHRDGKGLYKDCMLRLARGESVAGISISSDIVSACQEKNSARKESSK